MNQCKYEITYCFDETISRDDFNKIKVIIHSFGYARKETILKQAKTILNNDGWDIDRMVVSDITFILE